MATYGRAAYGSNPLAGASRNNAADRGWGLGWPNAQESKMLTVTGGGVKVRVRREVGPLVQVLLNLTVRLGYMLKPDACWGFANRPIRGTRTASNHSWGLAVDLNSEDNPMGSTFVSTIPPGVVHAWEACGFYWGGRYANRPDSMHFEYVRRPADVLADLARAERLLTPVTGITSDTKTPTKEDDDMTIQELEDYMARLWSAKGSVGAARAQDRAWQQAVLNESKAQTAALKDIATALKAK
ncbi:M15 family metallopeptidase [Kribbella sp. NPDC059898]|uniref:M15 family metallopeptidase n=1 Tax=Kribbella sp. NPDC059898 TaxID=3346995 RepID=UPI00364F9D30